MSDAPPPVPAPVPAPAPAPAPVPAPTGPAKVTIEDFRKLDLRVGKILSVKDHPNANKLYLLEVDIGTEKRQVVAGMKVHYKPEELTGQHVIIIANLAPAVIRGSESQGMMLATANGEIVGVLTVDPRKATVPGAKVS